MSKKLIEQIISGGQTGADRAALDVAIELDIPHGGWCPIGRRAEDGVISDRYRLKETPHLSKDENLDPDGIYKKRTELNVIDSDGTLIFVKDDPIGGTLYTIEMAIKHNKPFLIFNIETSEIKDVTNWVNKYSIKKLNIAGPRASQCSEIYQATYELLKKLL